MGLHSQSRMASVADAVGWHLSVYLMFTGEGKGSPSSSPNPRDLKKGRNGEEKREMLSNDWFNSVLFSRNVSLYGLKKSCLL